MEEHLTSLLSVRKKSANDLEYFLCKLKMEPLVQINSPFFETSYGKVLYCSELEKERGVRFLALGRFIEAQALLDTHLSSKWICLYSNIDFLAYPIEVKREAPKLSLWQKVAQCAFKIFFPLLSAFFWWQNSHIHIVKDDKVDFAHLKGVNGYFKDLEQEERKKASDKLYSDLFHSVDNAPEEVLASTEKSLYIKSFKAYVFEKLERASIDQTSFEKLFSYLSGPQVSIEVVELVHNALDGSSAAEEITDKRARELSLDLLASFKEDAINCAIKTMGEGIFIYETILHLESLIDFWKNPHIPVEEIAQAMESWASDIDDQTAVVFATENISKLQEKYFKSPI